MAKDPNLPARGQASPTTVGGGTVTQTQGAPPAHLPPGAAAAAGAINSAPVTKAKPTVSQSTPPAVLNQTQQSIYDLMNETLKSWGLESLSADLKNLIIGGDTATDTLALALSQTAAYKARFAGNAERVKNGLPELTPAQYLATEESYRNVLNEYGIPQGFYDDKASTDNLIGKDISASELNDRVKTAADLVYNSPASAMTAWNQFYGGGQGGAIAALLDPTKAAPLVEQQAQAAEIGGAAIDNGLTTTASRALGFARDGITLAQAQQAYSNIAQRMQTDTAASARFGVNFGQTQEEDATLGQNAQAANLQQSLYAQEQSLFGGHAGSSTSTLDGGDGY